MMNLFVMMKLIYGSCMIDYLLFDMIDDYSFEMIFWNYYHSLKKGLCWPSVRDYLLFDIRSAQSTDRFFMIPVLKWYMTFISKWVKASYLHFEMLYDCHFKMRGTKFSYTKLFSSGEPQIFYWRKHPIIYIFRTQLFAQCLCPYTCVEIYFKKGDGLLCQILIILQC